ncbi:DUF1254 domain-containing protein [Variovorax sp. GB1R11]|uniref:DUF1254 domain-containing protein n=1 Tax=Variovorax sp. GB1R11 TaxID=3443741 RepID=UPI003F48C5B1
MFTPMHSMKKFNRTFVAVPIAAALTSHALAQGAIAQNPIAPPAVPVGVDTFVRAETDTYLTMLSKAVGLGKLWHVRDLAPIDNQRVIRMNRDTLYSSAAFDLDAGPVTITLPDAGKRYLSAHVINQDHYTTNIFHGAGAHTLSKESVGTRYSYVIIRAFVDPGSADDLKQAHALQDAIRVSQRDSGKLELPAWDVASLKKVRDALITLASTMPDLTQAFGTKASVNPIRHLVGAASAWGGLPEQETVYLNVNPRKNDGTTVYRLSVKDVPVDGFWSVSVYNAAGFFEKNPESAYTVNNVTARPASDGTITVQFGGCDGSKTANCLPITPGWNYFVRLYLPRAEAASGAWKFPEAQPVN